MKRQGRAADLAKQDRATGLYSRPLALRPKAAFTLRPKAVFGRRGGGPPTLSRIVIDRSDDEHECSFSDGKFGPFRVDDFLGDHNP